MKHYDFEKAVKLVDLHRDLITSASLGMHEDWFWTAETIFENGEFKRVFPTNEASKQKFDEFLAKRKAGMSILGDEIKQYDDIMIAGINGSDWATPTLQLIFTDGEDKMFPCYIGEETPFEEYVTAKATMQYNLLGCLSGPVQNNITPLTDI